MNADVENLVLDQLRAIRGEIGDLRREFRTELGDLRQRVSSIERHIVNLQSDVAVVHQRLDHVSERIERIERRLELADSPA
ncbi:MAG: hypothetical protein OXP07_12775 [Defluviicoccus sp.]|nr:hypothetical protein [Defluviicoccus sp.]